MRPRWRDHPSRRRGLRPLSRLATPRPPGLSIQRPRQRIRTAWLTGFRTPSEASLFASKDTTRRFAGGLWPPAWLETTPRPHRYVIRRSKRGCRRPTSTTCGCDRHGPRCSSAPVGGREPHPSTDLTADHIEPQALGGSAAGPIRVLCRSCNAARGVKDIPRAYSSLYDP